MEKDMQKTDVKFLIEKGGFNYVLAYFPNETYTLFPSRQNQCYSHVGQHSGCMPTYASKLKKATPAQYAKLKAELEGIGYNLNVIN